MFTSNLRIGVISTSVITFLALSTLMPIPASAQTSTWYLDSVHSNSRLFVGSHEDPYSLNLAVAQVSGSVHLDFANPSSTVVEVAIYPAGTNPTQFPDSAPAGSAQLEFEANRTVVTDEGLAVTGNLIVRQTVRSISAEANEGYAGAVYGEPVVKTTRRQITLLFQQVLAETGAVQIRLSGMATVPRESFPELLPAIRATNWPPVIEDEHCQVRTTTGEDYSGPSCTGLSIEIYIQVARAASLGEDFHGFESKPPAGNQVMLVLDLTLLRNGSNAAGANRAGTTVPRSPATNAFH